MSDPKTIAVLFARADSIYKQLPGCDVWDKDRNALAWPGGSSVVAHPPCRLWAGLRHLSTAPLEEKQCAIFAVKAVRDFGGCLEHPQRSTLWKTCGLPGPGKGRDASGGFTVAFPQWWYGHPAEKWTWIYICGLQGSLPEIPFKLGQAEYKVTNGGSHPRKGQTGERRGVIRPAGERVCTVTKQRVITWEPTGELPGLPRPRGQGKTGALRAELEACKREAAGLRRECADKAIEINALKAKLSKWGRPPNSIRAERAMRNRAQEFPCMVATNVRQEGHETTNGQHNGEANGACPGARETGHGVPCADSARPENPSQGGNDGHGSGCACSSRTAPNPA